MSSPQAPEDGQSGDDPPGDLRSVLVTSVLNLEPLDEDLFRGRHYWVPSTQRLFGGQIVGQALVAAAKSVSEDVHVHSLHCYFVRKGDPKVPVLYQVERTRTGVSFSVRFVKAVQHGRPIFICQASFQKAQPSPLQHQFSMPTVPLPEELLSHEALIDRYLRWLPGPGSWAAVASGWGPGCVLCSGGCDPSEALGLKEQAVARGTSLAWGFKDLPSPPTPEAGVTTQGWAFGPEHPIKRLIPLELLAFNPPGPELQPSLQPSTPGLLGQSPWPLARLAWRPKEKGPLTLTWGTAPRYS
ncbi:acyl-coenzyme A thioesterase 8 isoform X2 [Hippopotamus amphibius kiboko]|uniref:acyl-coenzyme A thioesterase 8 isoform X2 n=1 Tax=Hippopotamus amphibius kiboko TaxID=575201 RepID=UPI002594F5E4|nr:acyl-coenzyme A thioesterase 8 isoform X2 [Hippopotamus amphibius kiboko]